MGSVYPYRTLLLKVYQIPIHTENRLGVAVLLSCNVLGKSFLSGSIHRWTLDLHSRPGSAIPTAHPNRPGLPAVYSPPSPPTPLPPPMPLLLLALALPR